MSEKRKISIKMDDLTFGELEDFENATGLVMSDAMRQEVVRDKDGRPVPDPDDPKGRPLKEVKMPARAMMGMMWLALRKEDPDLTFSDVRNMRLSEVDFDIEEGDEEDASLDPTQESAKSDSQTSE